jgi:hypothetical protein
MEPLQCRTHLLPTLVNLWPTQGYFPLTNLWQAPRTRHMLVAWDARSVACLSERRSMVACDIGREPFDDLLYTL